MKNFKQHLSEAGVKTVFGGKVLNQEFLNRVMSQTYFDLKATDFQSLKFKKEIQYIIAKHWFPKFDVARLKPGVNVKYLNKIIGDLRSENRKNFNELFGYNKSGIGPGEVMIYFLIDDAAVQGGSSAGVDIVLVNGKEYELKGANVSRDKKSLYNFKLGGTPPIAGLIARAVALKEKLGLKTKGKGQQEVNSTQIKAIKQKFPGEWKKIEDEYKKMAFKYFQGKATIFFNNNKTESPVNEDGKKEKIPGKSSGDIAAIKSKFKIADIELREITSNTIKPTIRV